MLIKEQLIEVTVMGSGIAHFKRLGYNVKHGDIIYVPPEHLQKNSMKVVKFRCDICGDIAEAIYENYNKRHDKSIDVCRNCNSVKRKKTCLEKYGYENYTETPQMKEQIVEANLNKYGVPCYLQSQENREKIKQTLIEKYGADNPMKVDSIKEKARQTNLERYGVEHVSQSDAIKEKTKKNNLEKYGVEYPIQRADIKAKAIKTLYENGSEKTSKQQLQLYEMVLKKYPEAKLNFPFSSCSLDIFVNINDIKIDIEYDGWYFHQDKQKDVKRDKFLQANGFKTIRIRSAYQMPIEQELFNSIDCLVNTDRRFIEIKLSDWKEEGGASE